jgi:hypothetical protein
LGYFLRTTGRGICPVNVAVGAWGFTFVRRQLNDPLRFAWLVFFAGIFLTAFGSGYYHLRPDNESLAWDRLTMTIGFMSFVAIVIGELMSGHALKHIFVALVPAALLSGLMKRTPVTETSE